MSKFDLCVLGGGPAGYVGALKAAKLGMSVALVEESNTGGTCLNRGCIPTKALLHSALLFKSRAEWESLGIIADGVSYNENKAYSHKDEIVESLERGIRAQLKNAKVAVFDGRGCILDSNHLKIVKVKIDDISTENLIIETENILIATGSCPAKLPILGIDYALTSDDVLKKPIEGRKIVIIGGGVIGVEFATFFSAIGKEVIVIEAMDKILPMFSKEITIQLSSTMKKDGISILCGAKVVEIGKDFVKVDKNGVLEKIECDTTVVAIGRKANIQNIGLDSIGIDEKARCISVDNNMYTGKAKIYAAGDVVGRIQLAHYASASAIVAVENMFGIYKGKNLSVVPSCVYTNPEIAVVGDVSGEDTISKKYLLGGNGKSLINGINRGFVKIYCKENIVVGAEVFGGQATEIIGELALAVSNKICVLDVAKSIHAHPTVYEAVGETAEMFI